MAGEYILVVLLPRHYNALLADCALLHQGLPYGDHSILLNHRRPIRLVFPLQDPTFVGVLASL
jgi:hypothetical protein